MRSDREKQTGFGPPWSSSGPGNWPQVLQAGRGNIKPIILQAVSEKPMHGYEIIQHFAARSGGHWRPSPGSVYPTLRKLEAEGLVKARVAGGIAQYRVTAKGKKKVLAQKSVDPWEGVKHPELLAKIGPLMRQFMPLMHHIAMNGTATDAKKATSIVEQATIKLRALNKEQGEKK